MNWVCPGEVQTCEWDWPVCFCRFRKLTFLIINVSTHNSKSTIFGLWQAKHIKATTPKKWVWTNLMDTIRLAAVQRIFIPIQIAAALVSIFDIGKPWWGNWPRPWWNFFGQGEVVRNTWKKSNPGLCLLVNCTGIRDVKFLNRSAFESHAGLG